MAAQVGALLHHHTQTRPGVGGTGPWMPRRGTMLPPPCALQARLQQRRLQQQPMLLSTVPSLGGEAAVVVGAQPQCPMQPAAVEGWRWGVITVGRPCPQTPSSPLSRASCRACRPLLATTQAPCNTILIVAGSEEGLKSERPPLSSHRHTCRPSTSCLTYAAFTSTYLLPTLPPPAASNYEACRPSVWQHQLFVGAGLLCKYCRWPLLGIINACLLLLQC